MLDHRAGLYLSSKDGVHWDHDHPQIGYRRNSYYFDESTYRLERPQLLFDHGSPKYLFLGLRGGRGPGSGVVFEVKDPTNR